MCGHDWSPVVYVSDCRVFEKKCAKCGLIDIVDTAEAEIDYPLHNGCTNNGHIVKILRPYDFMITMVCTRCDYYFEIAPEDVYDNPTV